MKRILSLLLLVSAMSVNAQSFDERDLIGTWNTTGLSYPAYKILSIESITLRDALYDYDKGLDPMSGFMKNVTRTDYGYNSNTGAYDKEEIKTSEMRAVTDFFISNNNKLHIVQDDNYVLHFIIEELTATTMKVKTYDGLSFSLTKEDSSASVRAASITRAADESTYNLSGQKVENITDDGIYIQNGQKIVIKK
jgi:hypothetical protein